MRVILECERNASEALLIARRAWKPMEIILEELKAMNNA